MRRLLPCAAALALLPFASASADVRLATIFGDHMVVQQGAPVPVWGWAAPGEEVTVELAGQKKTAKADDTGKWRVTELGFQFVRNEATVQDRCFVFAKNSKIKPPPSVVIKQVNIVQALDTDFDYTAMMAGWP